MGVPSIKRGRRERLGGDVARVWARELVLGNPYAKAILLAIANYMNEDGTAWPGTATIARDTDIGEETVVKRLRWLEAIGAIALFKCWVDENGRRNHDGRGKPTSSEIRFLFDADIDAIEQAAKEAVEPRALRGAALSSHSEKISPRPHGGLDSDQPPASPPVAPDQPPPASDDSIEGNLELEEIPPNPPLGGDRVLELSESFKPFGDAYPAPIADMGKAIAIWSALSEAERAQAIIGAKGYAKYIDDERRARRNRAVKDAHRWLRDRLWQGYLDAGQQAQMVEKRFDAREGSEQWRAWVVFYRCCGEASGIPNFLITGSEGARIASVPREWPPVGNGIDADALAWRAVEEGSGQFAAWMRRLRELPGVKIRLRSNIIDGRSVQFLKVPLEWPPNKGTTGPPPLTITKDDDEFVNKQQGLG